MRAVVVVGPPKADATTVAELGRLGVATVHEAAGRTGLLGADLRPLWPGAAIAGTAVTVLCPPGDNLMVHAAIEQAGPGDVIVITTTSPSTDGFVGELITTALAARKVAGLVTTTGVRDVAAITSTRFPVWSRAVSAQGTVKATAGAVNVPISIAGTIVMPGDAVIADDDGVVVVPRLGVAEVAEQGRRREEREEHARAAFAAGELSLDRNGLRPELDRLGVRYVRADPVTGLAADPEGS
ncbi:MAG TPA: 4-carboxy-4-hydroxy-2-oxoadipate aldolase/oxaloacetate decarboxylase [Streptosporangiaceae bacterium]|nr:4-carboxy-4-hydroxy-2-oxoadipate aldolase/oxaloacetate decarboxylase [Streptosporangiaceae bacterium]